MSGVFMMLNVKEIKALVKESLGMTRAPRNLDVFYYFHHVYYSYNHTNNKPISRTLTESYVSTNILQNRLGIMSKDYKKYFNAWIDDMSDDYKIGESCKIINKWSKSFIDLMNKTQSIKIPQSFFDNMYWNTLHLDTKSLNLLKKLWNQYITNNNNTISRTLTPYHNTISSSFRWYHWLQNLPKDIKAIMFKDMWDVDIDSCFSSIAYHELGIKDERLNPLLKEDFRQWVMKELGVDYKEAKQIISRLFTGKHTKYNKIQWYNDLFNTINKAVWNEIKRLKCAYPEIQWSHHQYFTYMEQRLINKIIPEVNLVLRMHDGFICQDKPDMNKINQLAYPHIFSSKKI
jgi:hypothetical protein